LRKPASPSAFGHKALATDGTPRAGRRSVRRRRGSTVTGGRHDWPAAHAPLVIQEIETVKLPIMIHTEEDYDRAQQRVAELNAMPDGAEKERELHALAEAMLAFELRRDDADD
jgi:hypothetical protein